LASLYLGAVHLKDGSVVIRTAQIVSALCADEFAVVAAEDVTAIGANLLMMNGLAGNSTLGLKIGPISS
jgi:hypothetical protein